MPDRAHALSPEALEMVVAIARTGSFAAAARELGKVPSALTYSVRQLEDALDVLLFDRRSRQARMTAAGEELLREGQLLLQQMNAVANRVQRVASGWEAELTVAVDKAIAPHAVFDLMEAFYALKPPTRLRMRSEVMTGTWEALASGQADLAIGVAADRASGQDIRCEAIGEHHFVLTVAPHHALAQAPEPLSSATLAQHRIIAVADTARDLAPMTVGILPGQDVLTLPSMAAKLEAQLRGLGCGFLPEPMVRPHVAAGRLIKKEVDTPPRVVRTHYAWRQTGAQPGMALTWWLHQLASPATRCALLDLHEGLIL
ncbi:MAG: LysR family transcriptional regulator [Aquabacterium sp.]|uniref:LysR substrate-binding domain-containing protein n=1 Tax=Aquabacterium sp. TaxID=1872578 RepID=UPI0012133A0C|nr:LysR substrate-binding domain-containing protein [Aquabacterium sp.]TAK92976.1 MAG: LysR family transcriptional regulator [Aquabacterium sp.]